MPPDATPPSSSWPDLGAVDGVAAAGLYRILDETGAVVDPEGVAAVDVAAVVAIWRTMVRVRTIDARMLALQRQGRIGFYGAATGQEAAVVAPAEALQARDWIHPALREGGMALHRGYPLDTYLAQCFGNDADTSTRGRQMPCHYGSRAHNYVTLSSVMTTQLPQAVGTAHAMALRHAGPDRPICFVAMGDGATSEGDFHVAMNFAGVLRPGGNGLPLVFFCQNNQWAISTPVSNQCAAPSLASKAASYGLVGVRVDGNDALAVLRVMNDAAARVRVGGVPVFIETLTYRVGPHSTSDDPSRYRDEAVTDRWRQRDPLLRLETWLHEAGHVGRDEMAAWQTRCEAEVRESLQRVERLGPPALDSLFEDVWATVPPHLELQRQHAHQSARNEDAVG